MRSQPSSAIAIATGRHSTVTSLLQVWFLRHLQILGEAAAGLPQDVRDLAPDVPWPSIVGMRNVLVHGYFDIDADIVWEAARRDVPALRSALLRLLQELDDRE